MKIACVLLYLKGVTMYLSMLLSMVLLLCSLAMGQTTSGSITSNETWSGTVTLKGDVIISSGTVTIQPGAVVKFDTTSNNIVYGTSKEICLVTVNKGGICAVGNDTNSILFTSISSTPSHGSWGSVIILADSSRSRFIHCDIKFGKHGLEVGRDTGSAIADVPIKNCHITHTYYSAISSYAGKTISIDSCNIDSCTIGFFVTNSPSISIRNTYIHNVSAGIVTIGAPSTSISDTIDHVTIYNVDVQLAMSPQFYSGYCFFNYLTPARTFRVTNSIIYTLESMKAVSNGGIYSSSYNCYYDWSVSGGTNDLNNLDPFVVDAPHGDLRLRYDSPCRNTASDGSNRGAWQGTIPVFVQRINDTGTYNFDDKVLINVTSLSGADTIKVIRYSNAFPPKYPVKSKRPVKLYYQIIPSSNIEAFIAILTLIYDQSEFAASTITDESSLYCARFDTTSGKWVQYPSVVDTLNNTVTCTTTCFSLWGIGGTNGPLPVTLSSFTAQSSLGSIEITWTTQTEQSNLGWNILRATSVDGQFTQINASLIPGAGTSAMPHSYSCTDLSATAGQTYYYKLEQVDIDGGKSYSQVIAATVDATGIKPVVIKATELKDGKHVMYDIMGRRVNAGNMKSGVYLVKDAAGIVLKKVLMIE